MTREDVWLRSYWLWDCYYAVAFVFSAFMLGVDDVSLPWVPFTALGAIAVLYLVLLRPSLRHGGFDRPPYLAVAAIGALFLVGVGFSGSMGFALFAISPILSMTLPLAGTRIVLPLLIAAPLLAGALRDGVRTEAFSVLAPMTALLIVLSLVFGVWIDRVVRQSVQRGELIEELERTRAELARLSHEAGVSAERERLAGEIHDTLAQGFTSIVTLVQAAEAAVGADDAAARRHLGLAARTARENLTEARALIGALTPAALGDGSLSEALRRQLDTTGEECALRTEYLAAELPELPTRTEVVVLRTAQEALSNVRRHAHARAVTLRLSCADGALRLVVRDDGKGFDPAGVRGGYGLSGMRSRASQVGGTVCVHSGPGAGTTVELAVPL